MVTPRDQSTKAIPFVARTLCKRGGVKKKKKEKQE